MENWTKATVIVLGGLAALVLVVVFSPVIVAVLGIAAGLAVILLPLLIIPVIIVVVKHILDARDEGPGSRGY